MAIVAPISKFRRTNLIIYIAVCIGIAIYCAYDGYFNTKFIEKHSSDGVPDSTLIFNQKAPPFFTGAAVILAVYLFTIKNKKLAAEEDELIISDKEKIAYDSIRQIDRTYFESKGYFLITDRGKNGKEVERKISDRQYDNLKAILDHLVAKIT
jgi:hypothetical protein